MEKIPTLFKRGDDHRVINEVTPGAEWVIRGEGIATRKWDGTACMVRDGTLYKRYTRKRGRPVPDGYEPATDECWELSPRAKQEGWLPVGDGPEDAIHREVLLHDEPYRDGTYELIGPKVQGNPERAGIHMLVRHGGLSEADVPRTFAELPHYFAEHDIEGIVWHHPDGRMVKIKGRDFGIACAQSGETGDV